MIPGDRFVPWLSALPKAWSIKPLKYAVKFNPEVLSEDTDPDTLIHYVDISAVNPDGQIEHTEDVRFSEAPSRARRVVRNGDVIVSTVRTYLTAIGGITQDGLTVSTGFAVLRPGHGTDHRFLAYWMRSKYIVQEIVARSTGVSYPAINPPEIGQLPIPLMSLDEQRAIADLLDRETSRIDILLQLKAGLVTKLNEERTALVSQAVTRGVRSIKDQAFARVRTSQIPARIPWAFDVPASWRTVAVKQLARIGRKTFTDGDWVELPFISDEGLRLIQTGNVGIGAYKEQGFRYISGDSFRELGCTEVFPNDVLICRLDGPVGRACLAPYLGVRMITSVDNSILKVGKEVDPRFVVYLMSSKPWLDWIEALCRVGGGFRVRVSRKMLGDVRIPLPPYSEQKEIADYLDREGEAIKRLVARIEDAHQRLWEFRSALISAAVTGQIDVRNYRPQEATPRASRSQRTGV